MWSASFLAGFVAMALSFRNLPELRAGLVEIARRVNQTSRQMWPMTR